MPLILVAKGENKVIVSFSCNKEVRQHLMNIGLVIGERILVIDVDNEGLIVKVNNVRLAINRNIASKIMVA